LNKLADNDQDYKRSEDCIYLCMERIMLFVNLQVSKSTQSREHLSQLYDKVTGTSSVIKEVFPTYVYLMALYEEKRLGHLSEEEIEDYQQEHLLGLIHGLLGDSLCYLAHCSTCLGEYQDARQLLSGCLRIYLVRMIISKI
jgi:hypothetical protein